MEIHAVDALMTFLWLMEENVLDVWIIVLNVMKEILVDIVKKGFLLQKIRIVECALGTVQYARTKRNVYNALKGFMELKGDVKDVNLTAQFVMKNRARDVKKGSLMITGNAQNAITNVLNATI
jgi:hypothetical protein